MSTQQMSAADWRKGNKPKRPAPPLESTVQKACIKAFILRYPTLWKNKRLHSVPNGGHRNKSVAANMRCEGQVPGVWDLHLTVPCGSYAGLWIEMKRKGNGLTEEQKAFRAAHERDYRFAICYTVEEFLTAIGEYLSIEKSNAN